jgi:hypothetical protein
VLSSYFVRDCKMYYILAAKCSETTLGVDNESAHGPGRKETVEAVVHRVHQNWPSELLTVKANLALSRTSVTAPLALHSTCVISETGRAFRRTCLRRVLACLQPCSTGTAFFEALPTPPQSMTPPCRQPCSSGTSSFKRAMGGFGERAGSESSSA